MNRAQIYFSYVEDCLTTLNKIYSEIIRFSYVCPSQNSSQDSILQHNNLYLESEQNIKSLCTSLDRRTKLVGTYLGETEIPLLDYTIDQESWQQQMYIETTKITFINFTVNVQFILDYPEANKYSILIKENGVLFNNIFEETQNTIRVIYITEDIKLIYNDELIQTIRNEEIKSSNIKIESPPFFVNNLLRVRIPFHPKRLYLSHIGWARSVLDNLDLLIYQLKYSLLQYSSSLVLSSSGSYEVDNNNSSNLTSEYFSLKSTTTNFVYKP